MANPDLLTQNLKELKNLARLTENQFAELIGKPGRDSISKYFSRSVPPPDILRAISKAFEIDLHKLFHYPLTKSNYRDFLLDPEKENKVLDVIDDFDEGGELTREHIDKLANSIDQDLDRLTNDTNRKTISQLREHIYLILDRTFKLYNVQEELFEFLENKIIKK